MHRLRLDLAPAAVLLFGLAGGLYGLTGGLPGPARWRALPPELRGSPEFAAKLADSWRRLYEELVRSHAERRAEEPVTYVRGLVSVPAGWSFPPAPLVNSSRSLLVHAENPDEKKSFIILARMRPWKLDFEPLYIQYGGTFIYPLGAFLGAAHVLGLARLTPDLAHYLTRPEDMGRLYLLGRVFTLLFHLGTLWVLFETGRRLSGRFAGAAAALLFACAPFVVTQSHVLKPHPVAAFWLALAGLLMTIAVEKGRPKDYLACGLCAGAAAGASMTLLFAGAMPLIARALGGRGSWRWAAAGAGAVAAVAGAANPYLFLSPASFAWELTAYSPALIGLSWASARELAAHGLPRGVGLLSSLLLAAGVIAGLRADDRRARALAALTALGGALLWIRFSPLGGGESALRVHYAPFALACVLGGLLVARLPRAAAAALLTLALVESSARGLPYYANMAASAGPAATRERAADWIDANVPAGAVVGLLRFPEPPHTPPFRWNRVALRIFDKPEALGADLPEWIVAHRRGWDGVEESFRKRYDEAADFPPLAPLGLAPTDEHFFVNAGFVVLRRAGR